MAGRLSLGLAFGVIATAGSAEDFARPSSTVVGYGGAWEVALIRGVGPEGDRCIISGSNDAGQSLWLIDEADGTSQLQLTDHNWPSARVDDVIVHMQFDGIEVALRGRLFGWSFLYDYNDGRRERLDQLIPEDMAGLVFFRDGQRIAEFDVSELREAYPLQSRCFTELTG